MAGFVTYTNEKNESMMWSSANWIYRGFIDRLLDMHRHDQELKNRLLQCKYMQGIHLDIIQDEDIEVYERIKRAIVQGAEEVIKNKLMVSVDGHILDEISQREYLSEIEKLLDFARNI